MSRQRTPIRNESCTLWLSQTYDTMAKKPAAGNWNKPENSRQHQLFIQVQHGVAAPCLSSMPRSTVYLCKGYHRNIFPCQWARKEILKTYLPKVIYRIYLFQYLTGQKQPPKVTFPFKLWSQISSRLLYQKKPPTIHGISYIGRIRL